MHSGHRVKCRAASGTCDLVKREGRWRFLERGGELVCWVLPASEASVDIGIAGEHFGQRDRLFGTHAPIDAQQSDIGLVHIKPSGEATFAPLATALHPEKLNLTQGAVADQGLSNGRATLILLQRFISVA